MSFAARCSDALFRESGKSVDENLRLARKDVQLEMERLARLDRSPIQMARPEDERTRWIGQTTGSFARLHGGENFAVEHRSQRAAKRVRGLARREEQQFASGEFQAQRIELKPHYGMSPNSARIRSRSQALCFARNAS